MARSWGPRRKSGEAAEGAPGGGWAMGVVATRRHWSLLGPRRVGLQGIGVRVSTSVAGTNESKGSPPPVPGRALALRRAAPGRAVLEEQEGFAFESGFPFPHDSL